MRSQEVYRNRQNIIIVIITIIITIIVVVVVTTTSIIIIYSMCTQKISSLTPQGLPFGFLISS